jgi:hypothetical protein
MGFLRLLQAATVKNAVFWVAVQCSLIEVYRRFVRAMIMEAGNTSETPVNFYHTARHNIPEGSRIYIRRSVLS